MIIVSAQQLDAALTKIRYGLLNYSDKRDISISVELIKADPGSGVMVDCLQIKATAPPPEKDPSSPTQNPEYDREKSMIVEVFPASEDQLPRASVIESFKINSKY